MGRDRGSRRARSAPCRNRCAASSSARSRRSTTTDRRLLGAASVQGIDFDTAILAAVLAAGRRRRSRIGWSGSSASTRSSGSWTNGKRPNGQLTLRYRFAHHIYHNAFDESLRATRRAALSRAVAEQLIARIGGSPATAPATSRLLLESARDRIRAAEYWNQAAQASRRACTRTTRPRGSRSAGWRSSKGARVSAAGGGRARAADDVRAVGEDQPGLRRAGSRPRVRACARAVPSGRRSAPRGAGPHRPVRAPHRLGGDHDVARRRARDAGPVQPARRSEPADDRAVVARRRVVPPRGARGRARAPGSGRSSSTTRRFTSRACGRRGSSRESSAAASSRER